MLPLQKKSYQIKAAKWSRTAVLVADKDCNINNSGSRDYRATTSVTLGHKIDNIGKIQTTKLAEEEISRHGSTDSPTSSNNKAPDNSSDERDRKDNLINENFVSCNARRLMSKLTLPTFSGDATEYSNCIKFFERMVRKISFDNGEKLELFYCSLPRGHLKIELSVLHSNA